MLSGPFLIDAHVHFYPCFDRQRFFDAALENFRAAAPAKSSALRPAGYLLMSESRGHDYFRRFRAEAEGGNEGGWSFGRTDEDCSILASRGRADELALIAGRQIETAEGVEVLALACAEIFPDGRPLAATIAAVIEAGAIPVLPWGFGKWWLRRGALVTERLGSSEHPTIFLGDNSGRAQAAPPPRHFRLAAARGVMVLPGTDPLPFPDQADKPGSYGFRLDGELDPRCPAAGLKDILRALPDQPPVFGRRESLGRFSLNQVRMQLRKHLRHP